jgi:hypothetical protein
MCHEQETFFVDIRNTKEKDVEVFHYEEEVAPVDANDMKEEILDIEDDEACVEIPNFIPLLDDPPHNEIFKFSIMNCHVCIFFLLNFLPFKFFIWL